MQFYNNGSWGNINQSLQTLTVTGYTLNVNYTVTYVNSSNVIVSNPISGGYTIYTFTGTSISGNIIPSFELFKTAIKLCSTKPIPE